MHYSNKFAAAPDASAILQRLRLCGQRHEHVCLSQVASIFNMLQSVGTRDLDHTAEGRVHSHRGHIFIGDQILIQETLALGAALAKPPSAAAMLLWMLGSLEVLRILSRRCRQWSQNCELAQRNLASGSATGAQILVLAIACANGLCSEVRSCLHPSLVQRLAGRGQIPPQCACWGR